MGTVVVMHDEKRIKAASDQIDHLIRLSVALSFGAIMSRCVALQDEFLQPANILLSSP